MQSDRRLTFPKSPAGAGGQCVRSYAVCVRSYAVCVRSYAVCVRSYAVCVCVCGGGVAAAWP